MTDYRIHPNGGGRIYDNAFVAESVHLGPYARVSGNARVYGPVLLLDRALVSGNALLCGNAIVSDHGQVLGNARVYGPAHVSDRARVSGYARVFGNMRVSGRSLVFGITRSNSYPLVIVRSDGEVFSYSPCADGKMWVMTNDMRVGTMDEVKEYWTMECNLGIVNETMVILDALESIARIHGYAI